MSKGTRRMLQALTSYARDNGWCYPSVHQLAMLADLDERQARRALRWLETHTYIESEPRTGQTTIYRLTARATRGEGGHLPPTIEIKYDLNPQEIKACEPPPVNVPASSPLMQSSPFAPVVSCDGGASYDPAEDWTLQAKAAPQRKPWGATISPKEFYTRYRAPRERMSCAPADDLPRRERMSCAPADDLPRRAQAAEGVVQAAQDAAQTMLALEQPPVSPTPTAAQAQLSHLQAQIWRRPPTDPKKCRTYYALRRKAAQVERNNPKQAHALKMQARALEEVSELLIAATSGTADEVIDERRQVEPAPVSGRASSERRSVPTPLPGIQRRPRLVNVLPTPLSSTSVQAEAAPRMTGGGSHAQTSVKLEELDGVWVSAKRRQIAALERDGHQERVAALRRMLGWDELAEGRNVAVGHVHAVVPKLAREFEPGIPLCESSLHTPQQEVLSERGPQAVDTLGVNVEIGADFPHGILQAATEGGAIGPEPVATRGNGIQGLLQLGAGGGIEAGPDDALLAAFSVGASDDDHDVFPVKIGLTQAGDLGMAQAGGPEQIEHADQLLATAAQGQGSTDLRDLLRTVAPTGSATGEAGVEVFRDQLIRAVGIPLPAVHALAQLPNSGQRRLEVGIGRAALTENAQATFDELWGHVAEHARFVVAQGIEQDHAAIAVGIEGAVAENALVGGAVQLGLMAGGSFLEQAAQEAINLVFERGPTAHGRSP
jgi:hypothetical protein